MTPLKQNNTCFVCADGAEWAGTNGRICQVFLTLLWCENVGRRRMKTVLWWVQKCAALPKINHQTIVITSCDLTVFKHYPDSQQSNTTVHTHIYSWILRLLLSTVSKHFQFWNFHFACESTPCLFRRWIKEHQEWILKLNGLPFQQTI